MEFMAAAEMASEIADKEIAGNFQQFPPPVLQLHAGKTKVFANCHVCRQSPLSCGTFDVQILQAGESEKYLGRMFSIDDYHKVELDHRLSMGPLGSGRPRGYHGMSG